MWNDDYYDDNSEYWDDDEDKFFEWYDRFEKRKAQKDSIKEELLPVPWQSIKVVELAYIKDEKSDAEKL